MNSLGLNRDIVKALKDGVSSFCYFDGASGDSVDNMIVNAFKKYCPYMMVIELPAWKMVQDQDKYLPIKQKVQEIARMPICDCLDLSFGCDQDRPLLIRQPNNTQQWPDILIVYRKRGISIEIKSSKHDQIVWNSGLPRKNGIYIYNGLSGSENGVSTTYFLGQHVLDDKEQTALHKSRTACHEVSKAYNDLLVDSKWSLYARPMFNYTGRFLSSTTRKNREKSVLDFVQAFSWE